MKNTIKAVTLIVIFIMLCTLAGCSNTGKRTTLSETMFTFRFPTDVNVAFKYSNVLNNAFADDLEMKWLAIEYATYYTNTVKLYNTMITSKRNTTIDNLNMDLQSMSESISKAGEYVANINIDSHIEYAIKLYQRMESTNNFIASNLHLKITKDMVDGLVTEIVLARTLLFEPEKYEHAIQMNS